MSYYWFLNIWFHEGMANQRRTSFAWNELASAVQRLIGWRTEFVQIRFWPLRTFNKSLIYFQQIKHQVLMAESQNLSVFKLQHLRKESKGSHFFKCVVSMWGGVNACPDGLEHFFHVQMGNFLFFWESERLPGWFLHFLAHFWQCQITDERNRTRCRCSTVPVLGGRGGGAMPIWKLHLSKRGVPTIPWYCTGKGSNFLKIFQMV